MTGVQTCALPIYHVEITHLQQDATADVSRYVFGTLPVVIAISSNLRDARRDGLLPWGRLAPSLGLIAAGIACVNQGELDQLRADPAADLARYALGGVLAIGAVACWTWYPMRNADWLRAHPDRSPRAWATAQGVATLPLALAGYALFWAWTAWAGEAMAMPLGPRPALFVGLMLAIGLLASWLGTLSWNEASQRLPTALVGQLIVFETLSALAYALLLRGRLPPLLTVLGVALLVAGVVWALRLRPEPLPEAAAQPH